MRFHFKSMLLLFCAASFASTALAQAPGRGPSRERDERPESHRGPSSEAVFDRLDSNHDGSLSREEFEKGHERLREAMAAHHQRNSGPQRPQRGSDDRKEMTPHHRGSGHGPHHAMGLHRRPQFHGPQHGRRPQYGHHGGPRGQFSRGHNPWARSFHARPQFSGPRGPHWGMGPHNFQRHSFSGPNWHRPAPRQFGWRGPGSQGFRGPQSSMNGPHRRPSFGGPNFKPDGDRNRSDHREHAGPPSGRDSHRSMQMPGRPPFGEGRGPAMSMRPSLRGESDRGDRSAMRPEHGNPAHRPGPWGLRDGRPGPDRRDAGPGRPEGPRPGMPPRRGDEVRRPDHKPMDGDRRHDDGKPEDKAGERKDRPTDRKEKTDRKDDRTETSAVEPAVAAIQQTSAAIEGSVIENEPTSEVAEIESVNSESAATANTGADNVAESDTPPVVKLSEPIPLTDAQAAE